MTSNAIITIHGLQDLDDMSSDLTELETEGIYSVSNGKVEFSYQESELTGLEGTLTTFTAENGVIMLTRTGSVNAQMVFERGQKHYFIYDTLFGSITMGLETHSISAQFDEDGGDLSIRYVVDIDNNVQNRNAITINVRRRNAD